MITSKMLITGASSALILLLQLLVIWKLSSRAISKGGVKKLEVRSLFFVVRLETRSDDEPKEGGQAGDILHLDGRRRGRSQAEQPFQPEVPP